MKHATIFKTLWREKKDKLPSQKEIAKQLQWDESFFSRFLLGKQDVKSELFLQLVAAMPKDFQIEYWTRVAKELELFGLPPSPRSGGREGTTEEMQAIADRFESTVVALRRALDDRLSIREILSSLWPRWAGQNVRDADSSYSTRYQYLDFAGGINLVLRGTELKDGQYKVEVALVPKENFLREGLKITVEFEGGSQSIVVSQPQTSIIDGIDITMSEGEAFDIVLEYRGDIHRKSFIY